MAPALLSDFWPRHGGRQYGIDYTGGDQFLGIPQITRLGDFGLRTNDTFYYLYDYYDRWAHQLRIEAITPDDGRYRHHVSYFLEGKRAYPPEETGGPTVYTHRIEEQRWGVANIRTKCSIIAP